MLTISRLVSRRSFMAQSGQWLGALALASPFPATGEAKILKQLVGAYYAAYESLDPERLLAFYTEDCVLEDPTFHFKVEGKTKLRELFAGQRPLFLEAKFTVKNLPISGRHAISQHVQAATMKDTRNPNATPFKYAVKGISLFEFEQEKVKRQTDYYDVLTFQKQSGWRV